MSKIKVLQLCHNDNGPFVPICAMYLKAFDPEKYEVHTVFLRNAYNQQHVDALAGSSVHFLDLKASQISGMKLRAIATIIAFCRRENIDLIIAHRYKAMYIAGIASLFTASHTWGVAHTLNVFSRDSRRFLLQTLCQKMKIVGVSSAVTQNILTTCPKLTHQNRVFSLPNCLDESLEEEMLSKLEAREQLKLSHTEYIFGTIGRLVGFKAHDILLKAFAQLKPDNCKLVIIGDGELHSELEKLSIQLNIASQVIFTGHTPGAAKLIRAFDCFILPSTDEEAFGMVVLEAMMSKVPIICSNAQGPSEVIGHCGLRFQQGNYNELATKMSEVKQLNQKDRQAMTDKAYSRWHDEFSSSAFTRRSLALFAPEEHQ